MKIVKLFMQVKYYYKPVFEFISFWLFRSLDLLETNALTSKPIFLKFMTIMVAK